MATFTSIKAKIIAELVALTSYFSATSVFDHEPELSEITEDPFVVVVPSGNENDYASTSENKRTYAFKIMIYVEHGKARDNNSSEDLLALIVDDVINALDQNYTLDGEVLFSRAAPSRWGYVESTKEYRVAEINLQCQSWYTVSS